MNNRLRRRRMLSAAALGTSGLVVAAASWLGGAGVGAAVVLACASVLAAIGVVVWSSRSRGDLPALLSAEGDERQRSLDVRASAFSGLAMGAFSLVMAVVAIARQENNPWLLVCLVGAVSYLIALLVLRARS